MTFNSCTEGQYQPLVLEDSDLSIKEIAVQPNVKFVPDVQIPANILGGLAKKVVAL